MRKILVLTILVILLSSCSTPNQIQTTQAPLPTYTYYPTYTPYPTVECAVAEQNNELTTEKEMGVWLVGIEIAPGLWRSSGDCWSTVFSDKNKSDFHTEMGNRHIISIPANAFSVQFGGTPGACTWSYMGE